MSTDSANDVITVGARDGYTEEETAKSLNLTASTIYGFPQTEGDN